MIYIPTQTNTQIHSNGWIRRGAEKARIDGSEYMAVWCLGRVEHLFKHQYVSKPWCLPKSCLDLGTGMIVSIEWGWTPAVWVYEDGYITGYDTYDGYVRHVADTPHVVITERAGYYGDTTTAQKGMGAYAEMLEHTKHTNSRIQYIHTSDVYRTMGVCYLNRQQAKFDLYVNFTQKCMQCASRRECVVFKAIQYRDDWLYAFCFFKTVYHVKEVK